MLDLTKLSDEDLLALHRGDVSQLSDNALLMLSGKELSPQGGFIPAVKSGISGVKAAGYALAGRTGLMNEAAAEKAIESEKQYQQRTFKQSEEGWTDAPWTKFKETLGGSIPYMAAPVIAGALAPEGAAALAAAGIASAGQFTGTNLIRQGEDNRKLRETDLGSAVAASIPQAALDMIGFKMLPGVRQIFSTAGKHLTDEAALSIAQQGTMNVLKDYAAATGKAVGTEGVTEAAQQFFERLQAGLSLTDANARDEYWDSLIGGMVLGGALAPVGRYRERGKEKAAYLERERARVAEEAAAGKAAAQLAYETPTPEQLAEFDAIEAVRRHTMPIDEAPMSEADRLALKGLEGMAGPQAVTAVRAIPYGTAGEATLTPSGERPQFRLLETSPTQQPQQVETRVPEPTAAQLGMEYAQPGETLDMFAGMQATPTPEAPVAPEAPAAQAFTTVLTPDTLAATGLKPQSGFFRKLVNKDMADPAQQQEVAQVLAAVRNNNQITANTKTAIERVAMQAFGALATQQDMFGAFEGVTPADTSRRKARPKKVEEEVPSPPAFKEPSRGPVASVDQRGSIPSMEVPSQPSGVGLDTSPTTEPAAPVGAGVVPTGLDVAATTGTASPADTTLAFEPGQTWSNGRTTYTVDSVDPTGKLAVIRFKNGDTATAHIDAELANGWTQTDTQTQPTETQRAAETTKTPLPPVQEKTQPKQPVPDEELEAWLERFDAGMLAPEKGTAESGETVRKPSEGAALRNSIRSVLSTRSKQEYVDALAAIAGTEFAPTATRTATAKTDPVINRLKQVASDFLSYVERTDPEGVKNARARAERREFEVRAKAESQEEGKRRKEAEQKSGKRPTVAELAQWEREAHDAEEGLAQPEEHAFPPIPSVEANLTDEGKAKVASALAALQAHATAQGIEWSQRHAPMSPNERTTVAQISKALADWFVSAKSDRLQLVQSITDLPAEIQAAIRNGNISPALIQGFVYNDRAYMVADNIKQGAETAVFMHEVGAHVGLTDAEISAAANRVVLWATKPEGSLERQVYDAAKARMDAANETAPAELVAYATEEAVKAGVTPRAVRTGMTLRDVRSVQNLVDVLSKMFAAGIRTLFGKGELKLTAQNLIDLTYGAAHKALGEKAAETAKPQKIQLSLSPQTMAMLDADIRAQENMPGMGDALKQAYTTKGVSGALAFAISHGVADLRTVLANKLATVQDRLAEKYTNGVRDEFNNLSPFAKLLSAESAGQLTKQYFTDGYLRINPQTGRFETEAAQGRPAPADVLTALKTWGENNNMSFAEARKRVNFILQAVRIKEMQLAGVNATQFYSHMAQATVDQYYNEYQQDSALKNMSDLMDAPRIALVDWMVQTGRLTPDMGKEWKDVSGYVPFDRMEDVDSRLRNPQKKLGRGIAQLGGLPRIEGSETRPVDDVFKNYFSTMEWMLRTVVQQDATLTTLRELEKLGYAKYLGKNSALVTAKNKTVSTYIAGQKAYFELPTNADVAAFNTTATPVMGIMKVFSEFSHVLRTAITAIPTFTAKQIPEDIQRAIMHSGVKNVVGMSAQVLSDFKGIAGAVLTGQQHPIMERMGRKGIFGEIDYRLDDPGMSYMRDVGLVKRNFLGSARLGNILHKAEMIAQASDLALRNAIYEQTLVETNDEALALYRAQEIINFRHRGAGDRWGVLNAMLQTVPFYNAYVQSMDVTLRSLTGKNAVSGMARTEALKMFVSKAAGVMSISALYALGHADDDEYDQMDQRKKDSVWYLGKVGGQPVGLPVPTELGLLFKSIPERIVEYYRYKGTPEERAAMEGVRTWFTAALDTYGGRTLPIPLAARPITEIITNHSFFTGREIVGAHMRDIAPHLQEVETTSELAKTIANYTHELTGKTVELSPLHIDNVLRGYFGTTASMLMAVTNALLNPNRLDTPLHKIVGLGVFAFDPIGRKNISEFYDTYNKVSQAKTTFDELVKRDVNAAYDYAQQNTEKLAVYKLMANTLQHLSKLRQLKNTLRTENAAANMSHEVRQNTYESLTKSEAELTKYIYALKAQYDI